MWHFEVVGGWCDGVRGEVGWIGVLGARLRKSHVMARLFGEDGFPRWDWGGTTTVIMFSYRA